MSDLLARAHGRVGSADPAGSATAAKQGSLLAHARTITRPSALYTAGGQTCLEAFDSLDAVAARLRALDPDAVAHVVSDRPWVSAYPGLDLFDTWSVYGVLANGRQEWLGHVALPGPAARDPATRAAIVEALGRVATRQGLAA